MSRRYACNGDFNCLSVQELWLPIWALPYAKILINWCCRFLVVGGFVLLFNKCTLFKCLSHHFSKWQRCGKVRLSEGKTLKFNLLSTVYTGTLKWQAFTYWKIWGMFSALSLSPLQDFSQPITRKGTSTFFCCFRFLSVFLLPYCLFVDSASRDLIHECKIFSLYGTNFVIATNLFPRKQYHRWWNW